MVDRRAVPEIPPPFTTSVHPPERESPHDQNVHGGDPPPPHPTCAVGPDWFVHSAVQHIQEPFALSTDFRHSGWKHNRKLIAASLCRTEQSFSRRTNFSNCGSDAYILRSLDNPDLYRLAGSACHDRFCLPCAQERSQAISLNVIELTVSKTLRFLTLTLKATRAPLSEQLDRLYDSLKALRRRKLWKQKVTGGVGFLEITWSDQNNTWHPHFHILLEGSYLPYQQIRKLWYEITGDSYVIDIRLIRDQRIAARYVSKYAAKPFNDTYINRPAQLDEAILAFKGRKLLFTFGTWRGITLIATPSEGAWEYVASLETILVKAAHGDPDAQALLAKITDQNLIPIFARAPPVPPEPPIAPTPLHQLTFFDGFRVDWQGYLDR